MSFMPNASVASGFQQQPPPSCYIKMLQFLETGSYNPMYCRPYQTNVTPETMAMFQERTNGGTNIGPNSVSGVAGQILRPVSQVDRQRDLIDIPHGWGERRFLFMMEVIHQSGGFGRSGIRQLIAGYTDHPGASNLTGNTVHLDPRMKMFINSNIIVRDIEIMGPNGHYIQSNIVDNSQILRPYNQQVQTVDHFGTGAMKWVSMRPQDVFNSNQTSMFNDPGSDLHDLRTNFAFGVKKSRRTNNLPTDYISRVANAWQQSFAQGQLDDNEGNVMERAVGLVADNLISEDVFFNMLNYHTQFPNRGYVTYQELCDMQSGLDNIVDVRYPGRNAIAQTHTQGSTEFFHGATIEASMATILFQAIPAIMAELLLVQATFLVTNRTYTHDFDIRIVSLLGFQQLPIEESRIMLFINQMKFGVLRDLTRNNLIDLAFTMTVDISGESSLSISVDGNPPVPYVVPSFCDGRFVPVVTHDSQHLHRMSADIALLCNGISIDHRKYLNNSDSMFNNQRGPSPGPVMESIGVMATRFADSPSPTPSWPSTSSYNNPNEV